jgi:genetic interactor of prohibitins 3, mitochondrial
MSLIPGLHSLLDITPQRSLNRRSKTGKFYQGKKTEVSFIITRSDLLAPKKEQVDEMMPYLREVLRKELGRAGRSIRLGNVRCVSAKTGWWIKGLKEDIWRRGGGGWMVGKANVGKSQLFGVIFPKGRRGSGASRTPQPPIKSLTEPETKSTEMWSADEHPALFVEDKSSEPVTDMSSGDYLEAQESPTGAEVQSAEDTQEPSTGESASIEGTTHSVDPVQLESLSTDEYLEAGSLLPPAQIETDYPEMPLVSMLPGTTASPIRVPFGNGRGELIDLPGLARTDLELYVRHEHRPFLVMATRVQPEQQVIKPGKSVLLGGFIRITPTTPDVTFLAYTFTPLKPHLTSTAKAIRIQTQAVEAKVENIALPGTGEKIASAGTFHLKWDVTRQRAGPLTSRDGAAIKVEKLPFRVMAADILIEGVGWVEIVAQIRKRPGSMPKEEEEKKKEEDNELQWEEKEEIDEIDPEWPAVEVFSPEGKFIAVRMPLNAWLKAAMKPSRKHLKIRPRKSMKGVKKAAKMRKRQMA